MAAVTETRVDDDLAFAGAARIAELVRAKQVSPSELVELYLERIARLEPELNAYRVVLADGARADAKRAEERLAKGEEAPLLGVPVAIKDNVDYAGEVTTHGTAAYGEPAAEDGLIVRRLREAGASILGKTTLPELAIFGFTESPAWGDTRNPWDTFADSRWIERRQRRRDGGGHVRDRPRHRWGGVDSLPGSQLRALRAEAAAESDLALAGPPALVRALRLGLRQPDRDGHRPLPRRDERP